MTSGGTPCSAASAACSTSETGTYLTSRPASSAISAAASAKVSDRGPVSSSSCPHVPVVGQRRDRDVGDVVGVEERRGHVTGREPDLPAQKCSSM